jgi:hypothetical protein
MPTPTYTPLATVTLGSSASSVTFSSIPATYRDLILVAANTTLSTSGEAFGLLRFNGDSSTIYSRVQMVGNLGSAQSTAASSENAIYSIMVGSTTYNSALTIQIMDYSATDKHKTVLLRSSSPNIVMGAAGRWGSTSAITSIVISPSGTSWATGSTFSLYGVIA